MKRVPRRNNVVSQENSLIEARYILTLNEQRFLLAVISLIAPSDRDFQEYELRVQDLEKLFEAGHNDFYRDVSETLDRLLSRVLHIPTAEGYLKIHWLSSAEYLSSQGLFRVCFDPKLKPFLMELRKRFTSYRLAMILPLRSQYSIRLYQLMKQYEVKKERVIELAELKGMLCGEDSYPRYCDFKQRVLAPAQREINGKTDIYCTFSEIRRGKSVGAVAFRICKQEQKPVPPPPPRRKPKSLEQKAMAGQALEHMRGIIKGRST